MGTSSHEESWRRATYTIVRKLLPRTIFSSLEGTKNEVGEKAHFIIELPRLS